MLEDIKKKSDQRTAFNRTKGMSQDFINIDLDEDPSSGLELNGQVALARLPSAKPSERPKRFRSAVSHRVIVRTHQRYKKESLIEGKDLNIHSEVVENQNQLVRRYVNLTKNPVSIGQPVYDKF